MTAKKRLFLILLLCLLLVLSACMGTSATDDLSNYLQTDAPILFPEHALFPDKEALSSETLSLYQAETKSSLLFDDLYFLLRCTYSQAEYEAEVQRLANTGAEYREDLFRLPGYVMLLSGNCFEYTLLDAAENTVIYVYSQTADWNLFDNFPEDYLPKAETLPDICHYDA